MPGQILVAVVAELTVYRFRGCDGLFAELLRILEKDGAAGFGGVPGALRIGGADRSGWLFLVGVGRCFAFELFGLVLVEEAFEEGDGGEEVIVEGDEQVDVVEVFLAAETVGEVVAWVDGGAHFAAVGADEAEVAFAHFGWGAFAAQRGDGDGHRQVVAKSAQQFGVNHGFLG